MNFVYKCVIVYQILNVLYTLVLYFELDAIFAHNYLPYKIPVNVICSDNSICGCCKYFFSGHLDCHNCTRMIVFNRLSKCTQKMSWFGIVASYYAVSTSSYYCKFWCVLLFIQSEVNDCFQLSLIYGMIYKTYKGLYRTSKPSQISHALCMLPCCLQTPLPNIWRFHPTIQYTSNDVSSSLK